MKKVMIQINSFFCILFIIVNTIFWGTISLTSILYSPGGAVAFLCMRWWSKTVLWFCRVRLSVSGLEHVDRSGVQIFASNHSSHFDIFALSAALPVRFGWVAKKELFKIPFLGWHMKMQGYVSVDRKHRNRAIESLNRAAEQIRNGKRIAMFPEGTRSRVGALLPFKKGLFHLCIRTGVPIVPVYIRGTYEVLKPETITIRPGSVTMYFGDPLPTSGYGPDETGRLMEDLRARMESLQDSAFSAAK
jgi:1-acyl-sn-glycerol-3-phosphate acyltransferase